MAPDQSSAYFTKPLKRKQRGIPPTMGSHMEATETSPDKLQGRPDTWTTRSICYENLQLAEFLFLHVLGNTMFMKHEQCKIVNEFQVYKLFNPSRIVLIRERSLFRCRNFFKMG